MKQQKRPYEKPQMTVFRVQAEDAICAGSVNFNGDKDDVSIGSQDIVSAEDFGNDFSGNTWEVNQQ